MVCDLDPDLVSDQGHISMHNTYRTTSIPDHVTLASSNTVIWPFENAVISTFREVWSRDSLLTSCRPGPILSQPTISFELHAKMAEEIDLEKCNFGNFRSSVYLILTLHRLEVTLVHISGRGLPTHQMRSKSEKLFVDRLMKDVWTDSPEFQFIRSSLDKWPKELGNWYNMCKKVG